jgi:predicted RNA-binding protein YlqC (UPF0109 family)
MELHKRNGGDMTQPPSKRTGATLSLAVSNELAGAIIGPKGSTLNSIRFNLTSDILGSWFL